MSLGFQLRRDLVALVACACACLALPAQGQEAPATSSSEDRSYAAPTGSPQELIEFIRNARQRMQPRSLPAVRRMFELREQAADRILAESTAPSEIRLEAANSKLESLGMLLRLGDDQAHRRLDLFVDQGCENEEAQIQELLQNFRIERQLARWHDLNSNQRDALLGQVRRHVEVDQVAWQRMRVLFRLADVASESDHAPRVAQLLRELAPRLERSTAPRVSQEVPMLRGVARRLELVGQSMEVAGTTLEGKPLDWPAYRGKVVLVKFWATWCGPCVAELPRLQQLHEQYHAKGFEVVGVCLDDRKQEVEKLVASRQLPWVTLFHHPSGDQSEPHPLAIKYGVTTLPRTILVDREGKVVTTSTSSQSLATYLRERLGEPAESLATAAVGSGDEATSRP